MAVILIACSALIIGLIEIYVKSSGFFPELFFLPMGMGFGNHEQFIKVAFWLGLGRSPTGAFGGGCAPCGAIARRMEAGRPT